MFYFFVFGCFIFIRCVELFLRFGVKVDGRFEEEEEIFLYVVVRFGYVELVDLFLRRGVCFNVRDVEGWILLLIVCDIRCIFFVDVEVIIVRCF